MTAWKTRTPTERATEWGVNNQPLPLMLQPTMVAPSSKSLSPPRPRSRVPTVTREQQDHHKRNSHVESDPEDPHNLDARFVSNQLLLFDEAVAEIMSGCKQSCWMWFVLPTAPYIVRGVEQGSAMNQHFALRGDDSVRAYLRFERKGVNLRRNYITMLKAVKLQLELGVTLLRLFGPMDVHKAKSSLELFQRIAEEMEDVEVHQLCQVVLSLIELDRQQREIVRIRTTNPKTYRHIMTL